MRRLLTLVWFKHAAIVMISLRGSEEALARPPFLPASLEQSETQTDPSVEVTESKTYREVLESIVLSKIIKLSCSGGRLEDIRLVLPYVNSLAFDVSHNGLGTLKWNRALLDFGPNSSPVLDADRRQAVPSQNSLEDWDSATFPKASTLE